MFTVIILLIHYVVLLMTCQTINAQCMIDYTHYPLQVTNSTPPNVLILLDNSESMHQQAYEGDFDPLKSYDGYFQPATFYSYVSDSYFEINPLGGWNGNFLNWLTMRRIDLVRKVLTGGKTLPNSRTGSGIQFLLGEDTGLTDYKILKQYQEGAGTFYPEQVELGLETGSPVYFGLHNGHIYAGSSSDPFARDSMQFTIQVKKDALLEPDEFMDGNSSGLIHTMSRKIRLGLALFNTDGEGGHIANPIGGELNSLVSTIEQCEMTSVSPLAEALFECVRYFMQITPYYFHNPPDYRLEEQDDPFFFQEVVIFILATICSGCSMQL